jgi:hypothetical protein
LEAQDNALRGEKDVEFFLQLPTLALIPLLESLDGKRDTFARKADLKKSGAINLSVRV